MKDELEGAEKRAREMLLDGETIDKITEETRLRPKEINRIQREITNHF